MPRNEPKIGTKAPPKQGTSGGGLSKEAVMEAIKRQNAPKQAAPADQKLAQKREVRRNADMDKKYGI
jgi:hypothetical protein